MHPVDLCLLQFKRWQNIWFFCTGNSKYLCNYNVQGTVGLDNGAVVNVHRLLNIFNRAHFL